MQRDGRECGSVGREFTCADGWALIPGPFIPPGGSGAQAGTNRAYETALQITRDRDGRLIGREVERSHAEFSVWCGDGCKYVPIPLTAREVIRRHRMTTDALAERDAGYAPFPAAVSARLAHEEQARTTGAPGDARGDRLRRAAMQV